MTIYSWWSASTTFSLSLYNQSDEVKHCLTSSDSTTIVSTLSISCCCFQVSYLVLRVLHPFSYFFIFVLIQMTFLVVLPFLKEFPCLFKKIGQQNELVCGVCFLYETTTTSKYKRQIEGIENNDDDNKGKWEMKWNHATFPSFSMPFCRLYPTMFVGQRNIWNKIYSYCNCFKAKVSIRWNVVAGWFLSFVTLIRMRLRQAAAWEDDDASLEKCLLSLSLLLDRPSSVISNIPDNFPDS